MANYRYQKLLTGAFFFFAICLRLLLYWANTPGNAFDDHFEPIYLIMAQGSIPDKGDCWECFQPPLFYLISAAVGKAVLAGADISLELFRKLLQFLPCLYGILTVIVIYLILKRLPISDFARLLSFGMVCFLPRHIYMSAMHTNDTLSYLMVTLSAYLMLVVIDRLFSPDGGKELGAREILLLLTLLLVMLLTLFTKSTALVLLPMTAVILLAALACRREPLGTSRAAVFTALLLVMGAAVGGVIVSDMRQYGRPLPLNIELLDVELTQPPGKEALSFMSFKPWETIKTPILAPGNVTSFWTLVTGRMWFDMEPKFLQFTDPNEAWWDAYDDYLNRNDRYEWPGEIMLSPFTHFTGSALIALGSVPLLLVLSGITRALFGKWALWSKTTDRIDVLKVQLFLVLLLFNLAGVILHVYRYPFYSFMKAAFLLNSLCAFALFLALGVMLLERYKVFRWGVAALFAVMFLLTTVHVLHIVQAFGLLMPWDVA
jgi:hypothetical protein